MNSKDQEQMQIAMVKFQKHFHPIFENEILSSLAFTIFTIAFPYKIVKYK